MAKTLSELSSHTRVYLDEQTASDWTDAQVTRAINYAYMEVYTAVVETYEDYYRTKYTADLEADRQEYALPSTTYKVRRLEVQYDPDGTARKASPYNFDEEGQSLSSTTNGSVNNPRYYLSGNLLGLKPIPSQDVTDGIIIWAITTPSELAESTDAIDIPFPDRYGGLIPLGAAGELLRKGQQEEAVAAKYMEDFRIGLEKMKQELEDRFADGSKYIIDAVGDWNDFGGPETMSYQTF
jgi:hypothetical protein